jgi:hypothetical protein
MEDCSEALFFDGQRAADQRPASDIWWKMREIELR